MKTRDPNSISKIPGKGRGLGLRLSEGLRQVAHPKSGTGPNTQDLANTPEPAEEAKTESTVLSPEALKIAAQLADNAISVPVLKGAVRFTDLLIVFTTGIGSLIATSPASVSIDVAQGMALVFATLAFLASFQVADCYQVPVLRNLLSQQGRILAGWAAVSVLLSVVGVLTGLDQMLSTSWQVSWFASGLIGLLLARSLVYAFVRHWMQNGRLERRAIIVGGGIPAADLIRDLESQPNAGIRICGIFDDRSNDRSPPVVAGYPKLGNMTALVEFARLARIDMLIVSLPLRAERRIVQLLSKLWVLPVEIRLSAHTERVRFRERRTSFIGAIPFVDVIEKPLADWDIVAKRIFDLFFGSLALVVLSPLMLGTVIAIKLDSKGPVLFRQKRFGFNNEVIEILKFRSLYQEMADPDGTRSVTKGDSRVTRVGRFIRKSSIDELPQLFNVLSGSLSLVGPRPHVLHAHTDNITWDDVVDGYFARHKVKPGVTGWAQVNGWRGQVDTPEKIQKRVACDVYYIENWSILFDFKILLLTPFRLYNTKNAF
ncbi:undecaprenyl-phosphate glucose phosphotransferase [Roseibium sp. RKSG952]|uniref:undecaprenyl-phosphate glucose phosphotransferase n=1 Tax=Roseibium sp. RKSG952 TaxID=2529384 RepID=UPI0012BD3541|nr:undecaprenyl-phosphate glucose phosphotransferase [Roseibium sp. RKSG952]MTH95429.1 undecaprenyl-phosphate glucose phosphotransferase [Roseibium sp. RKSG952]